MNFHIVYLGLTLIAVIGGGLFGWVGGSAWIGAMIGLLVAFVILGPQWADYYFSQK